MHTLVMCDIILDPTLYICPNYCPFASMVMNVIMQLHVSKCVNACTDPDQMC